MKTTYRQSGISLIEVLVVIVLLLIGILSVIRVFPPGFLINRQTENTTLATRLVKQEIDRFTNSAANLPDAIVPVVFNPTSGGFNIDLNATPDDLTEVVSKPPTVWDYFYSDVNKVRRILGETVRVPLPSPTSIGRGSVYMLASGPFMDVSWDGQTRSIFISGSPMIRRLMDVDDDLPPMRSPAEYAIDYEANAVAFTPVGYPRRFLMTYSYYDSAGDVQTVVDVPLDVAANASGWNNLTLPAGAREMVPYSDQVSRRFAELAPADAWSPFDPYQFKVYSPKVGPVANVGVLLFNPSGHDYTEQTAFGPQPLTARIDYDVLDWRIIREDRSMPATPPYQVPLTLKHVKQLGEFNEDQTVYEGLFPVDAPADQVDLLAYNASTGERVPPTDAAGNPTFIVNYKEGTVTFSDAFGQANASGTFRFMYKAQGDWALQVQKAASSYRRRYNPNLGFGEFYVGGAGNVGGVGRLYFPLTEAGKTVAIREIWSPTGGAPGDQLLAQNVSCRINANRALFENLGGNLLTWAEIPGRGINLSAGDTVRGVQGVSFKARVLWRNSATVSESGGGNVARTRWRKVDLDTILTRSPQ